MLAGPYHEGMDRHLYLDHNATTPLLPEVAEAMRACWFEPYLNPASQHSFGRKARRILEDARDRIAELLGAKTTGRDADRLIFTSGGTESNNLALRGLLQASTAGTGGVRHCVVSSVEHPSIAMLADQLQREGHSADRLSVNAEGVIRTERLESLLRDDTAFVAAILGQNETGVIQPVAELSAISAKRSVPLHTDAVQAVAKIDVSFRELGAATMTVAAHKFHGPVGIGALLVRHDVQLAPQLFGGFQQSGTRPGTEPVALAVGMCRALELWHERRPQRFAHLQSLRDAFERQVLAGWSNAIVVGGKADRLPHTSNIAFVGIDRQALFMALDQAGIACSTGSACASGSSETSPVLVAMDCDEAVLASSLRFSFGETTAAADIDEAAGRILACCNNLRRAK